MWKDTIIGISVFWALVILAIVLWIVFCPATPKAGEDYKQPNPNPRSWE